MDQKNNQSDAEVYKALKNYVINNYFSEKREAELSFSPWEMNDFSILFGIEVKNSHKKEGIYVKIPKADLYKKKAKSIFPINQDDRTLGQNEFESLKYLEKNWNAAPPLSFFVKPIDYIEEYNAIITERIYAGDIFKPFRKNDLMRKFYGRRPPDLIHDSLYKIMVNLAKCHKTNVSHERFLVDKILQKIEYYAMQIKWVKDNKKMIEGLHDKAARIKKNCLSADMTYTFKGLDIRNILIDSDLKIFLLDPGKHKRDCKEADLARFIVTCRILYWGSLAFFLCLRPDASYEKIIIKSYNEHFQINEEILKLSIIKELIKHWYLANIALDLKSWPYLLKTFLRTSYINHFYKKQFKLEFNKL